MKKIYLASYILIVAFLMTSMAIFVNNEESYKKNETYKSDLISVMVQTESGGTTYESADSWPDLSGYVLNETNSYCTNGGTLSWDSTNNTISLVTNANSDKCTVYFDIKEDNTLASYIISLYTSDGENNLYYFDGDGSYTNAEYEADDLSYRYSGSDYKLTDYAISDGYTRVDELFVPHYLGSGTYETVMDYNTSLSGSIDQAISDEYLEDSISINNFVCFGDDCSDNDNLYRIIGVFKNESGKYEVKLIKYEYCSNELCGTSGDYYDSIYSHDSYYWNYVNYSSLNTYNNDWSISELNKTNLNTNYLNNIGNTWNNLITTHTWIVGGSSNLFYDDDEEDGNALLTYTHEIITPDLSATYVSKIGLIYISDYGYSMDSYYWSCSSNYCYGDSYIALKNDLAGTQYNNWLYTGTDMWTITPYYNIYSDNEYVCNISVEGYASTVSVDYFYHIYPTFYLNSDVTYVSGTGTIDDPIIIE